jgi:tetratricopeptide (TPR) repeat protein
MSLRVPALAAAGVLAAATARAGAQGAATPGPVAPPAPLVDSAWAAYERGDREGAAQQALRALAALPPAARAARFSMHVAAGRAFTDLGDPRRALPHLERALALDPRRDAARGWAVAYLGKARFALGDTAGARAALDEAAAHAPTARLAAVIATDHRLFGFDSTYARWRTLETPHLRLRVSPAAPILDPAAFAAAREAAAVRIAATLGDTAAAASPKRVDLFVWDSEREAPAAGLPRVHFARPPWGCRT